MAPRTASFGRSTIAASITWLPSYAYNSANLATEYYDSTQTANSRDAAAVAVKFTTPTVAKGKVYVGGRNAVTVYGLLSNGAPLTATPGFAPPGAPARRLKL
ncbi:MAG TPA: hypothetical protein VF126_07180 [Acidobacteriaceae bacterium]